MAQRTLLSHNGRSAPATSLATHYSGGLTIKSTTWAPGYPCCCRGQRAVKIRDTGNQTDDWNKVDCRICLSRRAHQFLVIEVQGLPGFRASVEIAAVQELRQALDVILGPLDNH